MTYEALSKWVTKRLLREDKTPRTGLIMRDHTIFVQLYLTNSLYNQKKNYFAALSAYNPPLLPCWGHNLLNFILFYYSCMSWKKFCKCYGHGLISKCPDKPLCLASAKRPKAKVLAWCNTLSTYSRSFQEEEEKTPSLVPLPFSHWDILNCCREQAQDNHTWPNTSLVVFSENARVWNRP